MIDLPPSTHTRPAQEIVAERIQAVTSELRVGKNVFVSWNNTMHHAEVIEIDGDRATLKVHDFSQDVKNWPEVSMSLNQIQIPNPCKAEFLEDLIADLKAHNQLVSPQIEEALRSVDRKWFCPEYPYYDIAVDIDYRSCISSPHMHITALELFKDHYERATSILDAGSGSGFLTAMLGELAPQAKVTGVECLDTLVKKSRGTIDQNLPKELSERIILKQGDGEKGCPENGPYDLIHVGFMCNKVPQELLDQLKPGGRLFIPVGNDTSRFQGMILGSLRVIDKLHDGTIEENRAYSCVFVPSFNSSTY